MNTTKQIRVDYYAIFREQRGLASEARQTLAGTLRDLYSELQQEFGFRLPIDRVKVAVADEFVSWDKQLSTGDVVVFIPPVAGG
jgi:molybdopterin converting factor small subunit